MRVKTQQPAEPAQRRPAVFLDRDGVLSAAIVRSGRPFAPLCLEDFRILPEAPDAVACLRSAGYLTVVVTNQKDISVGKVDRATVDHMNRLLQDETGVDAVYLCDGGDDDPCYKPNPGMLLAATRDLAIDLQASFIVGDRWRDVGAGVRAGCRTVFIQRGYDEVLRDDPDWIVANVREAADLITSLGREQTGSPAVSPGGRHAGRVLARRRQPRFQRRMA